jgi:hypothetical protein
MLAGGFTRKDTQDPSTVALEFCAQHEYQQTTHPPSQHFSSNYKTQKNTKHSIRYCCNATGDVFCRVP